MCIVADQPSNDHLPPVAPRGTLRVNGGWSWASPDGSTGAAA